MPPLQTAAVIDIPSWLTALAPAILAIAHSIWRSAQLSANAIRDRADIAELKLAAQRDRDSLSGSISSLASAVTEMKISLAERLTRMESILSSRDRDVAMLAERLTRVESISHSGRPLP